MQASVIIPAYNAKKTIGACLRALQGQSLRPKEIIVVDDGSSDGTIEIVKGFKGVTLLEQKHGGPARARNLGAEKAVSEIVVFTDSDCVPEKEWLNEMLTPFSDKRIVGVQGRYKTGQKSIVARFIQLEIEERYERMAKQEFIDFIGSYSAAYRKKVFNEMNGFDTSFPMASGEDTDLSFRIHSAGGKMVFKERAVTFHTHPESLAKYIKVKFFRALWRMKIYKKHKSKMVKDSYTSQAIKLQVVLFYMFCVAVVGCLAFRGIWETGAWALFGLLAVSTLPFAVWAARKDLGVGIASPAIILLRTAAFGFGMLAGIVKVAGARD